METTLKANSKRYAYLDVMRILACLLVCLDHAQMMYLGSEWQTRLAAVHNVVVRGDHLFLVITGALLLPVLKPWGEFVKHRMSVIVPPLLVWTVVYVINGFYRGETDWLDVLMLPLAPANGILWYLYVLLVIYITLPIASVAVTAVGKRGVEVFLVMWVIASLIPYEHGVINSLEPPQHPFSFYFNCYGYVILGYYLHRWPLPLFTLRHGWWISMLIFFGLVCVPLFEFTMQPDLTWHDHYVAVHHEVSINAVMEAILIFTLVQKICPRHYSGTVPAADHVVTVSDCTFGIYLMHFIVMLYLTVPVTNALLLRYGTTQLTANIIFRVFFPVLTFIVSLFITRLIMMLPFSRHIIGR